MSQGSSAWTPGPTPPIPDKACCYVQGLQGERHNCPSGARQADGAWTQWSCEGLLQKALQRADQHSMGARQEQYSVGHNTRDLQGDNRSRTFKAGSQHSVPPSHLPSSHHLPLHHSTSSRPPTPCPQPTKHPAATGSIP